MCIEERLSLGRRISGDWQSCRMWCARFPGWRPKEIGAHGRSATWRIISGWRSNSSVSSASCSLATGLMRHWRPLINVGLKRSRPFLPLPVQRKCNSFFKPTPKEFIVFSVRFNCIGPGRVETPFVLARLKECPDPKAAYREMASTQLNGRMAKPEEVAAAALYLASDESAMVTGSALMIDGGWSAGK